MGSSFTNLTVRGQNQNDVLSCLNELGKDAYVGPTIDGWTIIAEKESESFDFEIIRSLAENVTDKLGCAAVSAQFYNDDVLLLQIYKSGMFVESYSSDPTYGTDDILEMLDTADAGGDPEKIALAFDLPEAAQSLQHALHGAPEELDAEFEQLSVRMSQALERGDMDTVKAVQLRLMAKTRALSELGGDPFLRFAPGFDARRRYAQFVEALKLPCFSQDFGYVYLENGEELDGLDRGLLVRSEQQ